MELNRCPPKLRCQIETLLERELSRELIDTHRVVHRSVPNIKLVIVLQLSTLIRRLLPTQNSQLKTHNLSTEAASSRLKNQRPVSIVMTTRASDIAAGTCGNAP